MDNNTPETVSLRESEKRFRVLLENMSHGIQVNDCNGTIIYSNRAHHQILGYGDTEPVVLFRPWQVNSHHRRAQDSHERTVILEPSVSHPGEKKTLMLTYQAGIQRVTKTTGKND